jgi:hypothetical protein
LHSFFLHIMKEDRVFCLLFSFVFIFCISVTIIVNLPLCCTDYYLFILSSERFLTLK